MLKALEQLNPDQKQAATLAESAFVRAGPGTGKTQLLSGRVGWRVEHCGYAPRQVLALTFTRRAVSQFRQRLEELLGPALSSQVRVATFHSFSLAVLDTVARLDGKEKTGLLPAREARQILEPLVRADMLKGDLRGEDLGRLAVQVSEEIGRLKAGGVGPDEIRPGNSPLTGLVAEVYPRYQAELQRRGVLELNDLVPHATGCLRRMPQLARTMGVREVLLDETQDTSPVQLELLVALVQASQRQLRLEPTLMAVGDEKQQIYSFLHPSPYPRLEQVFAGARRLSLGIQYRYGPTLNHAANRLAWALGFDQPTTPARKQDDPQEQFAGLLPGMPSRHLPLLCYAAGTEEEEAAFIAEEIGRVQTCVPEAEIAVLARTRRQARFLSQLLHGFRVTHRFKTSQGESGEEEDGADSTEKVQVSTIHATKGAEFQVVFVTGLAQGVFPSHREGEHLEELKLFFVALTRARYLAYLTYPERVNRKGMERRTGPSWFLGLLG